MESFVIVVLEIGDDFIACAWILQVLHTKNVYDHLVDDLCLAMSLGVERCRLSELGFHN